MKTINPSKKGGEETKEEKRKPQRKKPPTTTKKQKTKKKKKKKKKTVLARVSNSKDGSVSDANLGDVVNINTNCSETITSERVLQG